MHNIHWLSLNWIDYLIIAVILISILIGLIRGFICELISLITWVAALLLAYKYVNTLAGYIVSDRFGFGTLFPGICDYIYCDFNHGYHHQCHHTNHALASGGAYHG